MTSYIGSKIYKKETRDTLKEREKERDVVVKEKKTRIKDVAQVENVNVNITAIGGTIFCIHDTDGYGQS